MYSFGKKMVTTNTVALNWFQQIQREVSSNQYGGKLVPTNTAGKPE